MSLELTGPVRPRQFKFTDIVTVYLRKIGVMRATLTAAIVEPVVSKGGQSGEPCQNQADC
jgi:hypothetical protein